MFNNDHTGAQNRNSNNVPFQEATNALNKINYPLSTGKKINHYKSVINTLSDTNGSSFARKLFTPQMMGPNTNNITNNIFMSGGKTNERLMDRFIPCRIGENLQAKFEAVSYN